ncbi:helix-turn-helix domain-containing protein [Kribbella monticola]|uniref:helix-turn-helix domain-containing protein n=1 Tax=Kribbella monticola TaxID=2185285 RepID=UPI00130083FC|nr:helix-turn-helix transcriptional regulator [Kribbella monticola]
MAETQPIGDSPGPRSYLPAFAELLKAVREESGLTLRQLGRMVGFHHTHMARVASDKKMPTWELVRVYLTGCGAGGDGLVAWFDLWSTVRGAEKQLRKAPHDPTDQWYWELAEKHWQEGLLAIRKPDALLSRLRQVTTPAEFAVALAAFTYRTGHDSVRRLEGIAGVSKTTWHAWLTGKRRPNPDQLHDLLAELEATSAEQDEFVEALLRITKTICGRLHGLTGKRCSRGEFHRGPHRSPTGVEWLEDGVLDGLQVSGRWFSKGLTVSTGPHY